MSGMARRPWSIFPDICRQGWRRAGNRQDGEAFSGLYWGVIAEKRIIENQNGQVTFLSREGKTGLWKKRFEPGEDFLRLILQHVLPRGFRRARDNGFLHGNAKKTRSLVQLILQVKLPETEEPERPAFTCSNCGTVMQIVVRKIHRDSWTQEDRQGATP
jgi:hypothetical protein